MFFSCVWFCLLSFQIPTFFFYRFALLFEQTTEKLWVFEKKCGKRKIARASEVVSPACTLVQGLVLNSFRYFFGIVDRHASLRCFSCHQCNTDRPRPIRDKEIRGGPGGDPAHFVRDLGPRCGAGAPLFPTSFFPRLKEEGKFHPNLNPEAGSCADHTEGRLDCLMANM